MVKLLVKLNADLTVRMTGPETGFLGDTAYDIAYKMGFMEIFEFIDQEIRRKNKDSGCLIM